MTEHAASIRILVADDHPIFRQGVAAMIGYQPDMIVVAEAGDGREAVEQFRRHSPDVALIDIQMPGIDGVAAAESIRGEQPGARIIILTTYDTDEDIYRALRAGVSSYLLKDALPEELLEAIRAVHRGQKRIPREIGERLATRMGEPELSEREHQVLRLVAAGKSNKEIGEDLFITEGTVKFHVNRILGKLGVTDRTQAVVAALKRGLVNLR